MIYLYAGLGMAMLLPILVGLQSAVYVAELEQGELAMQNSTRKIVTEWKKSQDDKEKLREDALYYFDGLSCPEYAPDGFSESEDEQCVYYQSEAKPDDLYIARIYKNKEGEMTACIVPEIGPKPKCPEEY